MYIMKKASLQLTFIFPSANDSLIDLTSSSQNYISKRAWLSSSYKGGKLMRIKKVMVSDYDDYWWILLHCLGIVRIKMILRETANHHGVLTIYRFLYSFICVRLIHMHYILYGIFFFFFPICKIESKNVLNESLVLHVAIQNISAHLYWNFLKLEKPRVKQYYNCNY